MVEANRVADLKKFIQQAKDLLGWYKQLTLKYQEVLEKLEDTVSLEKSLDAA